MPRGKAKQKDLSPQTSILPVIEYKVCHILEGELQGFLEDMGYGLWDVVNMRYIGKPSPEYEIIFRRLGHVEYVENQ